MTKKQPVETLSAQFSLTRNKMKKSHRELQRSAKNSHQITKLIVIIAN